VCADNEIHLEWRNEKKEAMLSCDKSFELHDDVTVLEFMHMAQVENEEELRTLLARCPDVATLLLERVPGVCVERQRQRQTETEREGGREGEGGREIYIHTYVHARTRAHTYAHTHKHTHKHTHTHTHTHTHWQCCSSNVPSHGWVTWCTLAFEEEEEEIY
jgi:ABC-type Zn2+ transport system substrate-binding protein/surface adhesin